MLFEEFEVSYEIKILRTHLESREADHVGEVPLAVAPVERGHRHSPEPRSWVALPLVLRQVVECYRSQPLPPNHDTFRLRVPRGCYWLDRACAQGHGAITHRAREPRFLLACKRR